MGIDELDELEDEMDEKVFLEYRQFNQNRLVKQKKNTIVLTHVCLQAKEIS